MSGSTATSGFESTRSVMFTICRSTARPHAPVSRRARAEAAQVSPQSVEKRLSSSITYIGKLNRRKWVRFQKHTACRQLFWYLNTPVLASTTSGNMSLSLAGGLLGTVPLVPVTELMDRGRVRISMTFGDCTHGMRKCVPSPIGCGSTPCNLSYMTARSPPSTAGGHRVDEKPERSIAYTAIDAIQMQLIRAPGTERGLRAGHLAVHACNA